MKRDKGFLNRVALSADLPGECAPNKPLIEIVGEQRVLIEHHRGVAAYTCNEIRINVSFGLVCILGTGLRIARVSKEQPVVFGNIDSVSLLRGCN